MSKSLKTGDSIPAFTLKDQNNQDVNIQDYVGKYPLVIYFYPKDDTPGCTAEACSFRDQFEVFEELDARVFGISADSPASHKKFAEKHHLNFSLLSDNGRKVEKQFGVPRSVLGLLPGRVTYIINLQGKIEYIFNSQMQAKKHVEHAISTIKRMNK